MPYIPCQFPRSDYLEHENLFEAAKIDDAEKELCEFNNDAEDLALELAYTRYRVAKLERAIQITESVVTRILTRLERVETENKKLRVALKNESQTRLYQERRANGAVEEMIEEHKKFIRLKAKMRELKKIVPSPRMTQEAIDSPRKDKEE